MIPYSKFVSVPLRRPEANEPLSFHIPLVKMRTVYQPIEESVQ